MEINFGTSPAGFYLLIINNGNNKISCEICSKLTIKQQNDINDGDVNDINVGWEKDSEEEIALTSLGVTLLTVRFYLWRSLLTGIVRLDVLGWGPN